MGPSFCAISGACGDSGRVTTPCCGADSTWGAWPSGAGTTVPCWGRWGSGAGAPGRVVGVEGQGGSGVLEQAASSTAASRVLTFQAV